MTAVASLGERIVGSREPHEIAALDRRLKRLDRPSREFGTSCESGPGTSVRMKPHDITEALSKLRPS
jgi:hypothetical protein